MGRLRDLFSPTVILGATFMDGFRTLPDGTEEAVGGDMKITYDRKNHEAVFEMRTTGMPDEVEKLHIPFRIGICGRKMIRRYIAEQRPEWPASLIRT